MLKNQKMVVNTTNKKPKKNSKSKVKMAINKVKKSVLQPKKTRPKTTKIKGPTKKAKLKQIAQKTLASASKIVRSTGKSKSKGASKIASSVNLKRTNQPELTPQIMDEMVNQNKGYYGQRKIKGNDRTVFCYRDENGKLRTKILFRMGGDKRTTTIVNQPKSIRRSARTMFRPLFSNIMKSFSQIGKSKNEYSIAVDLERFLAQPERIAIVKGGKTETMKIADFEFFGHTHPGERIPRPSTGDLRNMRALEPEFIVAGNTGTIHIYNVENRSSYSRWLKRKTKSGLHESSITQQEIQRTAKRKKYKNNPEVREIHQWNWEKTKLGRDMFFDITGVRIYTVKPTTNIELKDDPHPETKQMPGLSKETLERYHKGEV
jgi:hypothetical protein